MSGMILWVYIGVLVVGGAIGYFKAGSKVSLITSAIFALLLALCAAKVWPMQVAWGMQALLVLLFAYRLAKTKKFMPSGLMLVASLLAVLGEIVWR